MHTDNHSYYSVFNSVVRTVVRSTSQSYGDSKISGVRTPKLLNRLTKKIWRGWLRRRWLPACQNSKRTPHLGRGGVCVKYHPRVVFSARCKHLALMLRCQCPSVCPSDCLSVTEVYWYIIANLGFKFRSQFTAHCGRGACGREGRDHRREEWRDHLALC